MEPFHRIVSRIKWTDKAGAYTVGYFDRVENKILEMPLAAFLESEIPEHRARYIRKGEAMAWDRRKRMKTH